MCRTSVPKPIAELNTVLYRLGLWPRFANAVEPDVLDCDALSQTPLVRVAERDRIAMLGSEIPAIQIADSKFVVANAHAMSLMMRGEHRVKRSQRAVIGFIADQCFAPQVLHDDIELWQRT